MFHQEVGQESGAAMSVSMEPALDDVEDDSTMPAVIKGVELLGPTGSSLRGIYVALFLNDVSSFSGHGVS